MSDIPEALREEVIRRAANRCEYCQLAQIGQEATFHIDHVVPRAAAGPTLLENLALACVSCSLRKGASELGTDPTTGEEAPLFNPRSQEWTEHFRWEGTFLIGLTATARATVDRLALNRPFILAIREEEAWRGRHPGS